MTQSHLHTVAELLNRIFDQAGIRDDIEKEKILLIYPRIVGPTISQVSRAVRFENHILYIQVDTPVWRQELVFWKKKILENYRQQLRSDSISDIKFL
ncbi:MAG: DUF721 domain-containing protein [Candidatus Delongbacteria bacterium]|nr:DUF721 domain-containing protein [Candidatus Delongbacteria bacterium]